MNRTRTILALFSAVLLVPTAATAQGEEVSAQLAAKDEVTASQKSPKELRRDFWRAEKEFYAIYNELNDDGLYNVRCFREAPTGSVIKVQTCRPKFLDEAIKEGKIKKGTRLDSNPEVAGRIATYRQKMESLVATNPDLKAAADTLKVTHAEMQADKERRAKN